MIQKYIISLPPITKKNSQQILTNPRTEIFIEEMPDDDQPV